MATLNSEHAECPAVVCDLCVGATEPRALLRPEQPDQAAGHLPTVDRAHYAGVLPSR